MKQTYFTLLGALLCLAGLPAQAQYQFKDVADGTSSGLSAYTQNFNLPTATTPLSFKSEGNSNNFPEVYARFTLDGVGGEYVAGFSTTNPTPTAIAANDGTETSTAWYHFGDVGSTERAFGGIGGSVKVGTATYPSGVGYIGVRLKNSSTATIKNLAIKYAMEQWYNSSRSSSASSQVHYQRTVRSTSSPYTYAPASITTLRDGTWNEIPSLKIDAPSTTTPIAERNGNAATNRREAQTTLSGINLLPGEEIMIRFNYIFNATSNGNGISIDDIVVTPETNVFYSSTTGKLDQTNSWTTGTDGTGTNPANFTTANQTFYVRGTDAATNRVQQGNAWIVSGANSKIVVGIPASPAIGSTAARAAVGAGLLIDTGNKTIEGTIDVADGSTLRIDKVNPNLTLGTLGPNSTIEYSNTAGTHTLPAASYGNLKLIGAGSKVLGRNVVVNGKLNLNSDAKLTLGSYDLTLLRPADATGYTGSVQNYSASAYVVTSGLGQLRQSVPGTTDIVFPVGTAGSYTPAKLRQTVSTTEDVYSVRVIDNAYVQYDANEAGTGTAVAYQNVKKTWLVDEEVAGNANITMTLQWNKADATTDFTAANAHINHYTNGGWDNYPTTLGFTTVATDVYAVSRAGITSFSPFGLSSRGNGVLPVELVAFEARRTAAAVLCTWATASEKNNAGFVVERSFDGKTFQPMGRVEGHGTSSLAHTYSFTDQQPAAGMSYYRLRQLDLDGTEATSPVVAVKGCSDCVAALSALSIAPNPGAGRFELWTNFPAATPVQATVLNVLGSAVLARELTLPAGAQRTTLDLSAQPAGVYLVRLTTPAGPQTLRVVKH